jgi:hypothetical protein
MTYTSLIARLSAIFIGGSLLVGCTGQDVTKPVLERDISVVYVNRLAAKEEILGNPSTGLEATANCYRGGPDQADVGPGKDWRCDLTVGDADGSRPATSYFVIARTNACWAALVETLAATAETVDVATMADPATGTSVTDPVGAFDGCLPA